MQTNAFALATLLALSSGAAQAQQMVFTSWGGTTQDAQTEFWATPYSERTGTAVVQETIAHRDLWMLAHIDSLGAEDLELLRKAADLLLDVSHA